MTKKDLDEYIGEIGVYQWRVFVVVFLFTIYCTDSIQIIFLGADMPHWCRVPELADLPPDVQKKVAIPAASEQSTVDHRCKKNVFLYSFTFLRFRFFRFFQRFFEKKR